MALALTLSAALISLIFFLFANILVVFFVRFVMMENGTWTRPIGVVVWVSCALLVASTALIKQHYVFDGISGTALAFGLWYGWIRPALN